MGDERDGEGIVDKTVALSADFIQGGEVRVRGYLLAKHNEKAYARYYETEIIYE